MEEKRIYKKLLKLEKLLSENKYEEILNECNRLIKLDNKNVELYKKRALAYFKLKNYEEALNDYNRAMKLDSTDVELYEERGITYYELERYEEALNDYNKIIKSKEKEGEIYGVRGSIYQELGKYEEALNDYNKMIKLKEKEGEIYGELYGLRGELYYELERYEEALNDCDKMIKLKEKEGETYGELYGKRGIIYYKLGKYEEALNDYNKALKIDNKNIILYELRGDLYCKLRRYKEALNDYKKIKNTLNKKGENKELVDKKATFIYSRIKLKVDEEHDNILFQIGKMEYLLKNYSEAIEYFNELISQENKSNLENKYGEIKELITLAERKVLKVESYLTFADILGWKGIWQKTNNLVEKTENIIKLINIKDSLEKIKEKYQKKNEEIFIDINLISDTFVIGCSDLKIHNELCKCLIEECLASKLLIRGATSYGEYYNRDMVYLGGAVDEAASWHEKGEEIVIYFTPSARLQLEKRTKKDLENETNIEIKKKIKNEKYKELDLKEENISTKIGNIDTVVIDWTKNEKNRDNFYKIMSETIIHPEIAKKYFNTEKKIKER